MVNVCIQKRDFRSRAAMEAICPRTRSKIRHVVPRCKAVDSVMTSLRIGVHFDAWHCGLGLLLCSKLSANLIRSCFCIFSVIIYSASNQALGQSESVTFSVAGKIKTSEQTTYHFEMDVVGNTWYIRLEAPDDVAHLLYDGVSQQVVSFPKQAGKSVSVYVHNSPIPYGGSHFQTLWFGFCPHIWIHMPSNSFPNLQSYSVPPQQSNTLLNIDAQLGGSWNSVSLLFLHNSKTFPIEECIFKGWTNLSGVLIPTSFSRQIHSRLGMEFIPGKPIVPKTGDSPEKFNRVLEQHDVIVDSVSTRSTNQLVMKSIDGQNFVVTDQRFGPYGNWVEYKATNRIPDVKEVSSNKALATQINIAKAGIPADITGRLPSPKNRFVVVLLLGISVTIFAVFTLLELVKRLKSNKQSKKGMYE